MAMPLKEQICQAEKLFSDEETLHRRAKFLPDADRELVEAVLVRGESAAAVARLTGTDYLLVRRRIALLACRLSNSRFIETVRAMPRLSPQEAELARLWRCHGLKHSQLMRQLKLGRYALLRQMDRLQAKIAALAGIREGPK